MSTVTFQSSNGLCTGTIVNDGWNVKVSGTFKAPGNTLKYMSSAPPDLRMSRAGSALPWASEDMAYDNTPNKGEIQMVNGRFSFTLANPNCYYMNNGARLVAPHVHITVNNQHFDVEL
jgi:hypothetical protein